MAPRPEQIELRVPASTVAALRLHVEDFSRGEEVGFLICSIARRRGAVALLALEWHPVPPHVVDRRSSGYVSAWPAEFNSRMLQRALELDGTVVVIHSHGHDPAPRLSLPDRNNASEVFPAISRVLGNRPTGSLVLGDHAANGIFWSNGFENGEFSRLVVVGAPLETWSRVNPPPVPPRRARLSRQTGGLGPKSDALLASAAVAVIGNSGGGSHVCQQLAFAGVGRIIPIDDELVEIVNRGRMIGSRAPDVGKALKTEVMERLINEIDSSIVVEAVPERFPSWRSLEALKSADVVVACVDRFDARDQINAFCRRHHLPLVDLGLNIETDEEGKLLRADGQIIVVLPDSPCMRCTPLLSDAVLERERRARPPGYDQNPNAVGDPQVVSMNGTLASEATSIVLDLITGYARDARGAGWWQYDGGSGRVDRCPLPPHRSGCPTCAEFGRGDATL